MKFKIGKKTGLRYFSYADIHEFKPCYDPIKYIPRDWRGTAVDILRMESVPVEDRLWVCLRTEVVSEKYLRLFAVWCARQVQHLMSDPRSIAALDVAEKYARGEATNEELAAAWAAARAARDAAWAAARAARDAARAAAWAAGGAQAEKLIEMIETEGRERATKRRLARSPGRKDGY